MPDLAALNRAEETESDRLAALAQQEGRGALGRSLRAVAKAALAAAPGAPQDRRRAILYAVRQSLDTEALAAAAVASGVSRRGLIAGYRMHLIGLADAHNEATAGMAVEAEVTPQDEQAATRWPILGRDADDWSRTLGEQLRWEAEGALGMVAMGAEEEGSIVERLDEAERQHGLRLRSLAIDAFLAGVQAAQAEWLAHMRRLV